MALLKNSREFFFQGTPLPVLKKLTPLWQKKSGPPPMGRRSLPTYGQELKIKLSHSLFQKCPLNQVFFH